MFSKFWKQLTDSNNNRNNTYDFLGLDDHHNRHNQDNNSKNSNYNNNQHEDHIDFPWIPQKYENLNSTSKDDNKCNGDFQIYFVKNDEKTYDDEGKQETIYDNEGKQEEQYDRNKQKQKYESYWKCEHCYTMNSLKKTVLFINNQEWKCVNMNVGCPGTYNPKTSHVENCTNDDDNNNGNTNNNEHNNGSDETNIILESMIQIENENTQLLNVIAKNEHDYFVWVCPCGFVNDLEWEYCTFCMLPKPHFNLIIKTSNILPIKVN